MEEKNLVFKETPAWRSQQTIVKILKGVKYKFEPISEYENTQFVCITEQKDYQPVKETFRHFGFKFKDKYSPCPLAITACGVSSREPLVEPIIFTREDVLKIVADVPENYIGSEEL